MPAISPAGSATLYVRNEGNSSFESRSMVLLTIFLALLTTAIVLSSILYFFHRRKRLSQCDIHALGDSACHHHHCESGSRRTTNHKHLTIHTSQSGREHSIVVLGKHNASQPMLNNPLSPPHSADNVPQIHITFPDEQDEYGKCKNGRVVVVRVGDTTVGLEPLAEKDVLPSYEKQCSAGFQTIDINDIGGLKEKDPPRYQ